MRVRVLLAAVATALVLWGLLPLSSSGQSKQEELRKLQQRIDRARDKIGRKKGTERVLTTQISGYNRRIRRLQGRIGTLQTRQQRVQVDLDAKRSELESLRGELRSERARLVRLRARLDETRALLRLRLVEIYKAEPPDVVTVILNSDGFADLLERTEFIRRISDQDRKIVTIVRAAKRDSVTSEKKLARLEARQRLVTAIVQRRRDEIAGVKMELIGTRVGYTRTKNGKAAALGGVREDRKRLEDHVDGLEAASNKIAGQLNSLQGQYAGDLPIKRGNGSMIWPVNGPLSSPFGPRWGRLHAGIDISAGEGTPIHAADAGRVVLMQGTGASGGYGNYTCVQHTATMSTCYAHQSRFGTSVGASVSQGQVIGAVGNTGNSFGAHLHFEVRINGVPTNPLNYL
ncbi:MAG: Membrane proteins related to metalloendopeptidases [uncultured Solirubrobacteraceae bacterium]|uniref:Membrane proteins related to metalloendopeptidases n=1 Tax=uncultured Solirubrobacteraceae bacterium TaxID=1162706 RepID=A0A6J4T6W2_9ACTN|nr:MAG: Membrane proteins related to metalloendopeptidases [uncultured Solirubrobacteraceae bacterium]